MKNNPTLPILLLIGAVMADMVAGPVIFGKWVGLHFTAAAVAMIGLRRGSWWGVAAGWAAGAMVASLCAAPYGVCMFSLGLTGFIAGPLRKTAQLDIGLIDAFVMLGLLFFEDACSGLSAWAVLGVPWHPALLGVPLTVAVLMIPPRPRRDASRTA